MYAEVLWPPFIKNLVNICTFGTSQQGTQASNMLTDPMSIDIACE